MRTYFVSLSLLYIVLNVTVGQTSSVLRVEEGWTTSGASTDQWLSMLRKRLTEQKYDSAASIRRSPTEEDREWTNLIRSRIRAWQDTTHALASFYRPAVAPRSVLIVIGNRGSEDAFTHDSTTIGFDLAALQANYGDARHDENRARIDRFFCHEYTHLMQKSWLLAHPWPTESPLDYALAEIWSEGLGNYRSLSGKWMSAEGHPSDAGLSSLAELEPRFVARLAALACASSERRAVLAADLSWGRFDRKWGALTAALWLEKEEKMSDGAMRNFILAGPGGVWDLADRNLPEPLRTVLREARIADSLCNDGSRQNEILGTWHGTSTCVDPATDRACQNERVIYVFRPHLSSRDSVLLEASKIVDERIVRLYVMPLGFDRASRSWRYEIQGRFHEQWVYTTDGRIIVGTLVSLPTLREIRRVYVSRELVR